MNKPDLTFVDFLDVPVEAVGFNVGRRLAGKVEGCGGLFVRKGAFELQMVDGLHALLVLGFQGGDVQACHVDGVFQTHRDAPGDTSPSGSRAMKT